MAVLVQVTCLVVLLAMTYGWHYKYYYNDPFLSSYFDDPFDDWFSSTFDDVDSVIDRSFQRWTKMSQLYFSSFKNIHDDTGKIKKKLQGVLPVCTTSGILSTTTTTTEISPTAMTTESLFTTTPQTLLEKNRRKRFRNTKTTTCVQELIEDGRKYIYREVKTTDGQGNIIYQSSDAQSFPVNDLNSATLPTMTE